MMARVTDGACKVHCKRIPTSTSIEALSETFSARPLPSILGGNPAKANGDGFSYWAAEPKEVFEFTSGQTDPFPQLQRALGRYRLDEEERIDLPLAGTFCGGWIGYFSYELGRYIERLPQKAVDDLHMPLIRLCFHDRVIAYDHRADAFWLIVLELPNDPEKPAEKMLALEQLLDQSRQVTPAESSRARLEDVEAGGIHRNMTRENYLRAVKRIKGYIWDGEVYQVNYSHRFEPPFTGRPIQLFHWQNRFNPSDYAAFLDTGDFQIVSASPEMFVTVRDGVIQTKPIKGTRPRIEASGPQSVRLNEQQFHDLLTNEKEQAELNMIIDLERNDVARLCKPGTRRVVQPRTIETYPTVFHAVATVAGELRDDITFSDVLKAMFPGGSITGAPKIRAMEIIEELEPTARGVYTGAIGYLSIDATVCLNIAIRTIIIHGDRAFVQTGGGIVADSDPQAEWDETITKARALLAGIQAVRA
jgi:para-aminobenzoate synthetase component 1